MINVLVVDDSPLVRSIVRDVIEQDPDVTVAGEAENGLDAVKKCISLSPDLVLMDIRMPVMDGLEAVKRIMSEHPTPVLILSATVSPGEVRSAFKAVRAGAFEALPKPEGITSREAYEKLSEDLLSRIKLYAKVGQRRGWKDQCSSARGETPETCLPFASPRIVAIGASTGGPKTVQTLLSSFPSTFPCPVLLVQHISKGFARGFAQWLQKETSLAVKVVEKPERLLKGTVYTAPDGKHLVVRRGMAAPGDGPPVNACRPSVDVLFDSVAEDYGGYAIGVLLTGMGKDGAEGASKIVRAGGDLIVQDEDSSVIFGMPKAAIDIGAYTQIAPARKIPKILAEIIAGKSGHSKTGAGNGVA